MKKIILTLSLISVTLFATDFSKMNMEELNAMRGSVPIEERDAFRAEMQSRLQAMSPEERQQYISERKKRRSNGKGTMQRSRDGSGTGMMRKGGGER